MKHTDEVYEEHEELLAEIKELRRLRMEDAEKALKALSIMKNVPIGGSLPAYEKHFKKIVGVV